MKSALFISSQEGIHLLSNLYLNQAQESIYVHPARSISESIDLLEEHKFDMIYLGHKLKKDTELSELAKRLISQINDNKTKIYGTNKALNGKDWSSYYDPMESITLILHKVLKDFIGELDLSAYMSLPTLSVLEFESYPADLYVKKEGTLEKIVDERDEVDIQFIYELKEQHEALFFVTHEIQKHVESLSGTVDTFDDESNEQKASLATDYTVELLKKSGLPVKDEYVEISQKAQKELDQIVRNSKDRRNFLKDLLNKNGKFYYKHMSMTSLVCCFMLDEMMLTDESMKHKVCIAAQFQNIFLNSDDELKIALDDQLYHYIGKDKERIKQHAKMATDFLQKDPNFDADVLRIIQEQHGSRTGVGFPQKIEATRKIALIFQVGSLFSQIYLTEIDKGLEPDVARIFNEIHNRLVMKDVSVLKALKSVIGDL